MTARTGAVSPGERKRCEERIAEKLAVLANLPDSERASESR